MKPEELVTALRRGMVETGSLVCLGCGHEYQCRVHGCAVMREAAAVIERYASAQANHVLTLDELKQYISQTTDVMSVYVEMRNLPLPLYRHWCDGISIAALIARQGHTYGKQWRTWHHRPTNEERAAAPWG